MDRMLPELACDAPIAVRRAAVHDVDHLTWGDVYYLLLDPYLPSDLRRLIVERVDVQSGPLLGTVLADGVVLDLVDLLRRLLTDLPNARTHFAALWHRTSAEGRRTLLWASGHTTAQHTLGFGDVWSQVPWHEILALFPSGTPLTSAQAMTLHWCLECGWHRPDETTQTGDLWVDIVRTLCEVPIRYVQGPTGLHWMLADPPRLSDATLQRLLETPHPALRAWVLATLVPRHGLAPARPGAVGRAGAPLR